MILLGVTGFDLYLMGLGGDGPFSLVGWEGE